jgi:hypothetical protein
MPTTPLFSLPEGLEMTSLNETSEELLLHVSLSCKLPSFSKPDSFHWVANREASRGRPKRSICKTGNHGHPQLRCHHPELGFPAQLVPACDSPNATCNRESPARLGSLAWLRADPFGGGVVNLVIARARDRVPGQLPVCRPYHLQAGDPWVGSLLIIDARRESGWAPFDWFGFLPARGHHSTSPKKTPFG